MMIGICASSHSAMSSSSPRFRRQSPANSVSPACSAAAIRAGKRPLERLGGEVDNRADRQPLREDRRRDVVRPHDDRLGAAEDGGRRALECSERLARGIRAANLDDGTATWPPGLRRTTPSNIAIAPSQSTSHGVTGTRLALVTRVEDTAKTIKPWVTFAGCVLVVGVLYWAQAVLVPFALAILRRSSWRRRLRGSSGGSGEYPQSLSQ
jgi:hypothetical protein